jgi:hypothetical protein
MESFRIEWPPEANGRMALNSFISSEKAEFELALIAYERDATRLRGPFSNYKLEDIKLRVEQQFDENPALQLPTKSENPPVCCAH